MRIVIPSAGLGSRFLPLTRAVPKELLLLGEWPLIHHALLEAEGAGFDSAIVVISPNKQAIRTYFEPAPELERELAEQGNLAALARLLETQSIARRMQLTFIEQWTRGPGQAVLLSRELTGEDTFAVLLPDDVVPSVDHWRELQALSRERCRLRRRRASAWPCANPSAPICGYVTWLRSPRLATRARTSRSSAATSSPDPCSTPWRIAWQGRLVSCNSPRATRR